MYIPSHFRIENEEMMYDIIKRHSFATLISQHHAVPFATHLPLIIDQDKKCLYGHFARPNPQWKEIKDQDVLAIFQGPHCYISPSWYETHIAVPTWNYVSVHVYGQVEFIDDNELLNCLSNMVLKYEEPKSTYKLDQVDPNFIKGMTKGIVGFKIKIDRLEGKAKLSQNHPIDRQELVIQRLEESASENDREIASFMKENLKRIISNGGISF